MNQESIIPNIRQQIKRVTINYELKKDLQEDEIVCEHCHGTGLEIADNVYGIRGDITHIGVHFPYKHQSISFCKHCYNGVLKLCPGCGKPRSKSQYDCSCGFYDRKRRSDSNKKDWETWNKAKKISQNEAFEQFKCLYIDNMDRYVFDEGDLECAIDDYLYDDGDENTNVLDLRVYGTTEAQISLDADSIVSSACEDLHEDAYERCDDIDGLQKLLDEWCEKQTGTGTFYPDTKIGVILKERDK